MHTSFKIPVKQAKIKRFKSLNFNKLRYGIYNVKVDSDHAFFYKVFSLSEDNYYTHFTLEFAHKYKEILGIEMTVLGGECLVYETEDVVESSSIFGDWFSFLSDIKKKEPKNKLVKMLMSSLWGSLCQYKRQFYNDVEFWKLDVSEKDDETSTKYKLIKETYTEDSTTYQVIERLKPFLTSFSRCLM